MTYPSPLTFDLPHVHRRRIRALLPPIFSCPLTRVRSNALRIAAKKSSTPTRLEYVVANDTRFQDDRNFGSGTRKRWQKGNLLHGDLRVTRPAQGDEIRFLIVPGHAKRADVMHVQRPLVFGWCLSAMLTHSIPSANAFANRAPFRTIPRCASNVNATGGSGSTPVALGMFGVDEPSSFPAHTSGRLRDGLITTAITRERDRWSAPINASAQSRSKRAHAFELLACSGYRRNRNRKSCHRATNRATNVDGFCLASSGGGAFPATQSVRIVRLTAVNAKSKRGTLGSRHLIASKQANEVRRGRGVRSVAGLSRWSNYTAMGA